MQRGLAHLIFWTLLTILTVLFLVPLCVVVSSGFFRRRSFTLKYLLGVFQNPIYAEGLLNSLLIAFGTTLLVMLIS